jgi:3-oxoacyl-[acyl-carrier-protein] synthase-3
MHSRIAGTGGYLPARIVTNADLAQRIDTDDEWVRTRTGICQRHIAAPGDRPAIWRWSRRSARWRRRSSRPPTLDRSSSRRDADIFPSTACIFSTSWARERRRSASGGLQRFCHALSIADPPVASGGAQNALVVGAEIYSRILDWDDAAPACCSAVAPALSCWCRRNGRILAAHCTRMAAIGTSCRSLAVANSAVSAGPL